MSIAPIAIGAMAPAPGAITVNPMTSTRKKVPISSTRALCMPTSAFNHLAPGDRRTPTLLLPDRILPRQPLTQEAHRALHGPGRRTTWPAAADKARVPSGAGKLRGEVDIPRDGLPRQGLTGEEGIVFGIDEEGGPPDRAQPADGAGGVPIRPAVLETMQQIGIAHV